MHTVTTECMLPSIFFLKMDLRKQRKRSLKAREMIELENETKEKKTGEVSV